MSIDGNNIASLPTEIGHLSELEILELGKSVFELQLCICFDFIIEETPMVLLFWFMCIVI